MCLAQEHNKMSPARALTVTARSGVQVPVVQRLDNLLHRINYYPVDKRLQNKPRYPLDSDVQPSNNGGMHVKATASRVNKRVLKFRLITYISEL